MTEFSTEFVLGDYEILTAALGEWESSEDGFINFCERLRTLGDPPEEVVNQIEEEHGQSGFMDWWSGMKKEVFGREQKAKDDKRSRMDKATLLKTKLILARGKLLDEGMDSLIYDDPSDSEEVVKEMPDETPTLTAEAESLVKQPEPAKPAKPAKPAEPSKADEMKRLNTEIDEAVVEEKYEVAAKLKIQLEKLENPAAPLAVTLGNSGTETPTPPAEVKPSVKTNSEIEAKSTTTPPKPKQTNGGKKKDDK